MRSREKRAATRARPAAARRGAASGSLRTDPRAAASAPGSPGGTSNPVAPSSIASGMPPTAEATTGTPAAMAWSNDWGTPSVRVETGEGPPAVEPPRARERLDPGAPDAVAYQQEPRFRKLAPEPIKRIEEQVVALGAAKHRDGPDDRASQPELAPDPIAPPGPRELREVHPRRNSHDPVRAHAGGDDEAADRLAARDDAIRQESVHRVQPSPDGDGGVTAPGHRNPGG